MSRGWFWFWVVVLVIFAPSAIVAFFTALGPLITTFAHNLSQIFAGVHK